ncbi:ThiF family adenylyltransferase [Alteromonas sp. ASW11-130]|uniref:ThiF family adenylyltransferase n=1 Tax=Alteromonas sp. ASW11-130 TaxID=3015775 RepID=UPI0022425CA8|nr:ThiF family adenylyltransferase [Alteromonas sp. ASW11-130]MCW8091300.1 ThiF family adenylyltransferase [Alteromonas sp. ASW11-130]
MFNYQKAYSRNIGWVTQQEQETLRNARVAVAGAGGVGSLHMLTLARLGIGSLNISDFDQYDIHNFNRQFGAFMSTLGQDKCQVMDEMVKDINPEMQVNSFPSGINKSNVDEFLKEVDLYIDSLDFFALAARKLVFKRCYELGIPVVTAAPLGLGCALLCFMPGQMTYEEYFRFEDKTSEEEQLIQFLIGLSPAMLQRNYLVDDSTVDFKAQKGPSTVMAVNLCAGMAESYALKILLQRGPIVSAPYGMHFDAYRNKLVKTWRPMGNRGLLPKIMFRIAKRIALNPK